MRAHRIFNFVTNVIDRYKYNRVARDFLGPCKVSPDDIGVFTNNERDSPNPIFGRKFTKPNSRTNSI